MSRIKDWAIEQLESDSNVDLEFREALAGFHESCDKIEEAIDNFVLNDRQQQFLKEHDEYCDGSHHYE